MQLIYSNAQLIIVVNAQNVLLEAGIQSQLKNEYLAGGAGDLSPLDSWPELWVAKDDVDSSNEIISQINNDPKSDWHCKQCGEENGGAFEQCWQCSEERPND